MSSCKRSEECRRERAEQLRGQVRRKLLEATSSSSSSSSVAEMVMLVDTLEHLGIDNHIRHEIAAMLHRVVRRQGQGCVAGSDDDHLHARYFPQIPSASPARLWARLNSDTRGLLSLFNAAHMAMPGEEALDDAIAFSRHHLRRRWPSRPVSRALDIPLPRAPKRLQTMRYLAEYEQEEAHDGVALELVKLEFELVRSLHLKELKLGPQWWKDMYDSVKLSYARDHIVENYFWTYGVFHEKYSRARIMFAKVLGLMSLMDDTCGAHATSEEYQKLN
uniref:Terpene synthase metal-binding domain-containing protein n=1 Tax=Oryza punctata TaxID=4537 RepID=A0A0E0KDZ7_ORYPU